MSLRFDATLAQRGFEVAFEVRDGETVAALGPNGAGKSTALALLAGLLRPDSGSARLSDRILFDLDGGRTRWMPASSRGVSLLAQDPLLFPHLTVRENVAFGPRSTGSSRTESRRIADRWLEEVEAGELADRKPAQLSGGQAQRVAIARALATDPQLLLLDEPLAALDVSVAPLVRRVLRRVLADRTVVIVTHDILDALVLADRVIVMNAGRIVDAGPTREVFERPRSTFAADLAGLNLLTGTRTATGMITADGIGVSAEPTEPIEVGASVAAVVRPASVTMGAGDGATFAGEVRDVEPRGELIRVRVGPVAADLLPGVVAELDIAPGAQAILGASVRDITLYALD